ncbi:MAG TPA: shikimate dehydrogenase [Candidatus Acidoferrales bacterium]|nr:shikimate dehydrogenase [Candidatus Acidoferrales bacterium]
MGRESLFGPDRICAVVAAPTAKEMARQLRRALRLTRTVELRLDWLKGKREIVRLLSWLRVHRPRATLIATCRRRSAGGKFSGGVAEQLAVLMTAVAAGCTWCDVELETAQRLRPGGLRSMLGRGRGLISWHDFGRTPANLRAVLNKLERCRGGAIKVATQCNSIRESLRVQALARGRRNVVAVPMGEIGLPVRVLALRQGSALAYAPVEQATAPGQVSLEEMKQLYRADELDRRTRVYGVIGNPVSHSLSPLLHNTGFIARRMNAVYLPFLVRDLRDFLDAVRPLGIAGFSVTLPHKQAILRHLDGCDPLAEAIGAVNTVVVRGGGKLYGYNTDYVGVLRALERRVALRGSRVLIFGAGGAARAAAFALAQGGALVAVLARSEAKARGLARAVGGEVIERGRLRREFFDAIVNATPVGMFPQVRRSPLRAEELNCRLVMDLIYRPMKTELLRRAAQRGIETVSGVEMFLAQGIAQWEIWSGLRAPERVMRRAVLAALRCEERLRGAA